MRIHFKTVRIKYYKSLVYFFGMSFLVISGCKSKNPNDSKSTHVDTLNLNTEIVSKTDSIKNNSIDNTKTVIEQSRKKLKTKKPKAKTDTSVVKSKPHSPSENPLMRPVTAYGIQQNEYKVIAPSETKNPNEK